MGPWRIVKGLQSAMLDSNSDGTLALDFPGVYAATYPTKGKNDHTVLHWCRVFMEQDVFEAVSKDGVKHVLDVGGMPCRAGRVASSLRIGYHSCNPTIDTADLSRKTYQRQNTCAHKAQACDCLSEREAAIAIHSLYYLTPAEWADILWRTSKRCGYAVVHRFDGERGILPPGAKVPEANYLRSGENVTMVVEGNSHRYTHSNMDWLHNNCGIRVDVLGKSVVLAWTLKRQVRGTLFYTFHVSEESHLPLALPYVVLEKLEINKEVLTLMQITSYSMDAGFLNLFPKSGVPRKIYMPLLKRLLLLNAGKFPSPANYAQLLANARKLSTDETVAAKEIREADWFAASLVHTATLAYLQTAVDLNNAQRSMKDYAPLLESLGYCLPHMRRDYGDSIWGRVLRQIETYLTQLGVEMPYHYIENVAYVSSDRLAQLLTFYSQHSSRLLNVALSGVAKAGLVASMGVVSVAGYFLPRTVARVRTVAVDVGRRVFNSVPYVRYSCDPALVQVECDARAVQYTRETLVTEASLRKLAKTDVVGRQAVLHQGCAKYLAPVDVRPNPASAAPTPYCVTEYAGLANTPSIKSDANKMSALLHRLLSGIEHSSTAQVEWQQSIQLWMRETEILPNAKFVKDWLDGHPVLTPREWLETEYGRRDDANMRKKLEDAVARYEGGDRKIDFFVEWFVKAENAPAKWDGNKCRGIFDPNPLFKVAVAPDVHRVSKLLWAWLSSNSKEFRPHNQLITVASGTNADVLGSWLGQAVETHGTDTFIMEVDISAFEANQTAEQNLESFGEMRRLGMSEESYKLYVASNKLVFKDNPRPGEHSLTLGASPVVARRDGANPSGLPDVTFRNTYNTLVAVIGLLKHLGVPDEAVLCLAALLLGDDNFTLLPARYRPLFTEAKVTEYYKKFHNWDAKVKLWSWEELAKAEFCSCYFVEDKDGSFSFTPKVGRVLSKTFYLAPSVPNKPNTLLGVVRGLGHYRTGFIFSRVMGMLEAKLLRGGASSSTVLFRDWSNNPLLHTEPVRISDPSTIHSDCVRYGLTRDEIRALLDWIGKCIDSSDFPRSAIFFPSHDLFDRVCYTDLSIDYDDLEVDRVDQGLPSRHMVRSIQQWTYYTVERGVRSRMRRLKDSAAVVLFPAQWGSDRVLRGPVA